jgi:hypothetical protein
VLASWLAVVMWRKALARLSAHMELGEGQLRQVPPLQVVPLAATQRMQHFTWVHSSRQPRQCSHLCSRQAMSIMLAACKAAWLPLGTCPAGLQQ